MLASCTHFFPFFSKHLSLCTRYTVIGQITNNGILKFENRFCTIFVFQLFKQKSTDIEF